MALPSNQDFTTAVDFTVTPLLSAGLLNQAFAELTTNPSQLGDQSEGAAFVLTTTDSAVGVPSVPDPTANFNFRWARYVWNRRPNNADDNTRSTLYAWNDSNVNDGTFLKWLPAAEDLTSLQAQVTAAQTSANTALNAANTANTNSSNALTQASAASTVAQNAANSVAQAESDASAASVAATTANNAATAASATANGASAVAANALAIAQASRTIANLTPGATGQRIRVNYANNPSLEYFNVKDTITILTESYGTGVAGVSGGVAGVQRPFNTIKSDTGAQCALTGGNTTLVAGTYRYSVRCKCNKNAVNGSTNTGIRLVETTGAVTIDSNSDIVVAGQNTIISLDGIVIVTPGQIYGLVMFGSVSVFVSGGLPASVGGVNEVYTTAIFERIG